MVARVRRRRGFGHDFSFVLAGPAGLHGVPFGIIIQFRMTNKALPGGSKPMRDNLHRRRRHDAVRALPRKLARRARRESRPRRARGRRRRAGRRRRSSSPTRPRARSRGSTAFAARPRSTAAASATRPSSTSRTPALGLDRAEPRPRPRRLRRLRLRAGDRRGKDGHVGPREDRMAAFEGSWDLSRRVANDRRTPGDGARDDAPPGAETNGPHSVFMDVYAAFCRHHMARFGTTQRQMAAVSAKNHQHSVGQPALPIPSRLHRSKRCWRRGRSFGR